MRPIFAVFVGCCIAPLMSGCAASHLVVNPPAPDQQIEKPVAIVPAKPFPATTLTDLILAERALHEGRPDEALRLYQTQGIATHDPNILQRGTQLALALSSPVALNLAKLWLEMDPNSLEARGSLATALWRSERYQEAIGELVFILHQAPEANFEQLLLSNQPTSNEAMGRLRTALDQLVAAIPANPHAAYIRGFWRAQAGDAAGAQADADYLINRFPDFIPAQLLKAKILDAESKTDEAGKLLRKWLKKHPESRSLRQNYAAVSLKLGQSTTAEEQYLILARSYPNEGGYWLAHALMALQNSHIADAESSLLKLLDIGQHVDEAEYYLGKIYSARNDTEAALAALSEVEPGPQYLPALQEIVDLLIKTGKMDQARARLSDARNDYPDLKWPLIVLEGDVLTREKQYVEARKLLDSAITEAPEEESLRYSRAMLAEQQDDLTLFESDMRSVLTKHPQNPVALNALGYTLADKTDRLTEAYTYITQAIKLSPNDPAIIDSMGWIEYRLGHAAAAEKWLRQAWSLIHDDEIGAHLGEVLWVRGDHSGAKAIWSEALKQAPASQHVEKARKHVGADK